ncbi:MAG: zinc-binding alcohol dehydrogenase family protein [Chloroflexota bacterium]|nr:zinc-binding alcohol dehydrogenase family protein [Chloroflexota bacterium]
MRTVILAEPGRFETGSAPEPVPGPGEALVRVHRIGVCGTDIKAYAGLQPFFSYPRILGHELGVEVIAAPAGQDRIKAGDSCAVEPYLACGECHPCRIGRSNCCESLKVLGVHSDGGMQPFISVPVSTLHPSEQLSLDQLALVETLGIGAHAVERSGIGPGRPALVVGAGPIGLTVVQFALAAGAEVTVLELSPQRRKFVEQFGVRTLSQADDGFYEFVFDATGNRAAMEASFDLVGSAGTLTFVGLIQDRVSFDDVEFHRRELTVLASRNSFGLFPQIIAAIERGRIDTRPWITARMSLDQVPSRFVEVTKDPTLVKSMVETNDGDL